MTIRTLAAASFIAVIGTALAQPPKEEPARLAPVPVVLQPKAGEKLDLPKLLATRVTVQKFDGKFKDAVKMLADAYDLPLVLTARAAEGGGFGDDDELKAADRPVGLPRLSGVRVSTLLALLCEQTRTKFLVYPDCIKIVPDTLAEYESGVLTVKDNGDGDCVPLLAQADLVRTKPLIKRGLVSASFKNKPLTEIIDEIAEATGANVAVSPLLLANVKAAPITVRFANTPVDAAVRMLCEMTECSVIEDANMLLVTTRERAAARAKEDAQKAKDRQPPLPAFGPQGFPLNPLPDVNAELLKLKEQNEQLKKELEEIKKLLKK